MHVYNQLYKRENKTTFSRFPVKHQIASISMVRVLGDDAITGHVLQLYQFCP